MSNKKFGFRQITCPDEDGTICADAKCGRPIEYGSSCFVDFQEGDIYCDSCGVVHRYERKKYNERQALGLPEIKINGE